MQQSSLRADTAQAVPAWYLTRGGKQYGPLSDRELQLLAERGGVKTDDLIWKSGFAAWKPVREVFDFTATLVAPATGTSQAVARANVSVESAEASKRTWNLKAKLMEEVRQFLLIFAYLWLVFVVFFLHEWAVLASENIGFHFWGLAALNALVLAKIMLIAENMRFAEQFHDRPLIMPIAYKAAAFTVLLIAAYIVEEIIVGAFHGESLAESFPRIGGGGPLGALCITVILAIAMVPFFAFREIARVVGEAEFRALMLGPGKGASGAASLPETKEAARTPALN